MAQGEFTFVMDKKDYKNLQNILSNLSKIDENKSIKQGLNKGISAVLAVGKSNLANRHKVKTGNLKRSMAKAVRKASAQAGFKRTHTDKQGSKISGGNHSHLLDRGTNERWTKKQLWKGTRYRGSISKGNPNKGSMFWTDAVEQEMPRAQENLNSYILQAMRDITNKH